MTIIAALFSMATAMAEDGFAESVEVTPGVLSMIISVILSLLPLLVLLTVVLVVVVLCLRRGKKRAGEERNKPDRKDEPETNQKSPI